MSYPSVLLTKFEQFLNNYRSNIGLDENLRKQLWDFYKQGYEEGYGVAQDEFNLAKNKLWIDMTNIKFVESERHGCYSAKWCNDCELQFSYGPCVCGLCYCKMCGKPLSLEAKPNISYVDVWSKNDDDFKWKYTGYWPNTVVKEK